VLGHSALGDDQPGGDGGLEQRGPQAAVAVAVLTIIPARIAARRPVAEILQAETA
jgi:hypothetical protein